MFSEQNDRKLSFEKYFKNINADLKAWYNYYFRESVPAHFEMFDRKYRKLVPSDLIFSTASTSRRILLIIYYRTAGGSVSRPFRPLDEKPIRYWSIQSFKIIEDTTDKPGSRNFYTLEYILIYEKKTFLRSPFLRSIGPLCSSNILNDRLKDSLCFLDPWVWYKIARDSWTLTRDEGSSPPFYHFKTFLELSTKSLLINRTRLSFIDNAWRPHRVTLISGRKCLREKHVLKHSLVSYKTLNSSQSIVWDRTKYNVIPDNFRISCDTECLNIFH